MMRAQPIGNGLMTARISEEVAAVLAALQLQGANRDKLLALDDAGWRKVLTSCDRMQLTLPLALRESDGFPAWVNERLTSNVMDTAKRFVRVQATYREAADALDNAGVPYLVLKGFTQSPDFVGAPQFRMQGDIDFYNPAEYTQAALDSLEAIGYEPAGEAKDFRDADHPPTLIRFRGWKWSGNPFDPEMPLAIEMHTCLWNAQVSLISLPEVDGFWKRRINRRLGELLFCSLDPIDHLCYFGLHVLRDTFRGDRIIHHALELANSLNRRAHDSVFWREWETRYSPRLKQMQAIAFSLAGAGFSSRLPDAAAEQIQRLPAEQRKWVEACGGNLLMEAFPRTRNGRLLQLLLSDSADAQRKILWKALAPGGIPGPMRFAEQPQLPGAPKIPRRRQLGRYLVYLADRICLNGAAVLRFVANGLAFLPSSFSARREARYQ
jgi:hypothetical protein